MPTVQRVTEDDVRDWIDHQCMVAYDQWDNNPESQCARDVYDRWRIALQLCRPPQYKGPKAAKEPST